MQGMTGLFAYIGPETIVPATSALAAIGGLVLAFGRSVTRPFVAGFFWLLGKKKSSEPANPTAEGPPVVSAETSQS